jgi:Ca2+-binding RTX toxin-like protein
VLASGGSTFVLGLPTFVTIQRFDPTRDELTVNGLAGDDRVEAGSAQALKLVADGGAGDDTLFGTDAADVLIGGDGRDFVDGNRGDDVALLGGGDDILSWSAGDGGDRVEGQAGADALTMSGSSGNETFDASAAGARLRVSRSTATGAEAVDTGGIERLNAVSFGGADTMIVNALTGTPLTNIDISLFDFGVPGGAQDVVVVNGSAATDTITAASDANGTTTVSGVPAQIRLNGTDAAGDRLEVNGLGGDDTIDSTRLAAAELQMRADGGAGNDVVLGGAGDDVVSGNDGADVIFAGSGDNVAFGGAGDDVMRGEEGDDFLDGGSGDDVLIGNAGDDILLNGEVVFDN